MGRTMSGEITVKVWDQDVTIYVYQRSKSVWVASGDYMGHSIQVTGRSSSQAASLWRDAARYKGG